MKEYCPSRAFFFYGPALYKHTHTHLFREKIFFSENLDARGNCLMTRYIIFGRIIGTARMLWHIYIHIIICVHIFSSC